jgi:uncharacterized protein
METLTFTTEDGVRLEGELRLPDAPPTGTAVLCHPHPRHGGSKDHPLLWAIRNDFAGRRGLAVLGFNFRGVMGSSGSYGGGREELRDVRAAIGTVRELAGELLPVAVAGWSFGASVAVREALDDRRVGALVMIGTPLRPNDVVLPPLPEPADLRLFKRPALLLSGEHDEYCPPDDARAYASGFPGARVEIVPGTDHYFWRREREAADLAGTFVVQALGLTAP